MNNRHAGWRTVARQASIPAALAMAIASAVLLATGQQPSTPARPATTPLARFALVEGTRATYAWSVTTAVSPRRPGSEPVGTTYSGTLSLRVVQRAGAKALAVQLSNLEVTALGLRDTAMERAYAVPFTVAIDARGRLGESLFPAGLAPEDRAVLDGAVRAFQIVLPAEDASRWETEEDDQGGRFAASYRRDGTDVVKVRTRYLAPRAGAPVAIRIVRAELRVAVDPDGPWLARAAGTEQLDLEGDRGAPLARIESRFTLERVTDVPSQDLAVWDDAAVAAADVARDAPAGGRSLWEDAGKERQREEFVRERVTLEALLDGFQRTHDGAAVRRLAAFLRVFPEEARRVPRALAGLRSPRARAAVLNALATAGTAQAQVALADVAADRRWEDVDRVQALVSTIGVREPTETLLDRVDALSSSDGRVGTTALLMLGALAPRAPHGLGATVVRQLETRLRSTSDAHEQAMHLRALVNAGAALPANEVEQYLRSSSDGVRQAAAEHAAHVLRAGPSDRIVRFLGEERAASVRAAFVAALATEGRAAETNGALALALPAERDPAVRRLMVGYLAANAPAFPANRAVLAARLERETDRGVVAAILNAMAR